jgi:hypothetical protein
MRLFWSFIGLLFISAALILFTSSADDPQRATAPSRTNTQTQLQNRTSGSTDDDTPSSINIDAQDAPRGETAARTNPSELAAKQSDSERNASSSSPRTPPTTVAEESPSLKSPQAAGAGTSTTDQTTPASSSQPVINDPDDVIDKTAPAPTSVGAPEPSSTEDETNAPKSSSKTDEDSLDVPAHPSADQLLQGVTQLTEGHKAVGDATPAGLSTGVKIVEREDGSRLINDRFVIRGAGTENDPYQVTWEFLVSASETYKPRLGQKNLPEALTIIDDKIVRITGFIAFPIMAQTADEMLVMLNQWDGCCIGVPPTPYDAIEVRLREPAEGENRLKVFGTVTGRFKIEPYLVKDWLIGLYTMSDAVVKSER